MENIVNSEISAENLSILSGQIILLIEEESIEDNFIKNVLQFIKDNKENLENSIKKERTNIYKQILRESDRKRDMIFLALRDLIFSCMTHKDQEEKEAAILLYHVCNNYERDFNKFNYKNQTGYIDSFITRLSGGSAQKALKVVNGLKLFTELVQSQACFKDDLNNCLEEDQAKLQCNLRAIKAAMVGHLNNFFSVIEIFAEIFLEEENDLVIRINEVITGQNTTARAKKKGEDGKEI